MNLLPPKDVSNGILGRLLPFVEALGIVLVLADIQLSNQVFVQGGARYTLLLIGVSYGAWRGGKWPALFALATTTLLGAYFFSPPRFSFRIENRADQVSLVLYLIVGLTIIFFAEAQRAERRRVLAREEELREAYRRLAESNARLQELVERRTADLTEIRRYLADEL